MKTIHSLVPGAILLLSAISLPAQEKRLNCDDSGGGDRARFCEMREQSMASAGSLVVDGKQNGGISVSGWDRGDVLVRQRVSAQGYDEAEARTTVQRVSVRASGNLVTADGPRDKSWSVSYEIFVPRQTNLNLTAQNGGIHVSDIRGTMEFQGENGGLHLANLAGTVKGRTANGGVHVELAGNRWDGQGLDLATENGGVHVNVPAGYSGHFETSTVNGSVHSDFPELAAAKHQTRVTADIGSGGSPIHLATTNGGVQIQRSN